MLRLCCSIGFLRPSSESVDENELDSTKWSKERTIQYTMHSVPETNTNMQFPYVYEVRTLKCVRQSEYVF